MDINWNKALTVAGILAVLAGLLVLPPLVQSVYGVSAVKTAFVVIVIYAGISFLMKRA